MYNFGIDDSQGRCLKTLFYDVKMNKNIVDLDVICIHVGKYDFLLHKSVKQVIAEFKDLLDCLTSIKDNLVVVFSAIVPYSFNENLNRKIKDFNNTIKTVQSNLGIIFIPSHSPFLFRGKPLLKFFDKENFRLNDLGFTKLLAFFNQQLSDKALINNIEKMVNRADNCCM
jgi:hypothetical protein